MCIKQNINTSHQTGYALIELPLVLSTFLALLGVVVGAYLWYHNGHLTTRAWISFGLAIPLVVLLGALLVAWYIDGRDRKSDKDSSKS